MRVNEVVFADGYVLAFSLRKNANQLLSTKRSPSDIEVVHGIRFVNAVMLLIAHKCMALMFAPYINRTHMSEVKKGILISFKNNTSGRIRSFKLTFMGVL